MAETIQLLEIERDLSGDNCEEAMRRYDSVLISLTERLSTALAQGVAPSEFERVQALREVVILARKLIRLTTQKGV